MNAVFFPALVAGCMFFADVALAQTVTGSMGISATVEDSCTLSASPMAFGTLAAIGEYTTTTVITLECSSAGALTTVTVGEGANSGAANLRQMISGVDLIPYTLHLVGTATALTHAEAITLVDTGAGTNTFEVTLEGKINYAAEANVGVYQDTVVLVTNYTF